MDMTHHAVDVTFRTAEEKICGEEQSRGVTRGGDDQEGEELLGEMRMFFNVMECGSPCQNGTAQVHLSLHACLLSCSVMSDSLQPRGL